MEPQGAFIWTDRALSEYYKYCGRNDYYDEHHDGKFIQFVNENEMDEENIDLELGKNVKPKDCLFIEMDDNFPLQNNKKNNKRLSRNEQIFEIIKHCYDHAHHPYDPEYIKPDAITWPRDVSIDEKSKDINNNFNILKPELMPRQILLIHGYLNECMNQKQNKLSLKIEQEILLHLAIDKLDEKTQNDYKQRIGNILHNYADWDTMDKISCIIPDFLWLGDEDGAVDVKTLQSLGISYVLNCAGYETMNVKYPSYFRKLVLFADDSDDYNIIRNDIAECLQFIVNCIENKERIFIHCFMGMNRSATITVAALMYFKGMNLWNAIKHTQERRGWILNNESFQMQLVHYANKLDLLSDEENGVF